MWHYRSGDFQFHRDTVSRFLQQKWSRVVLLRSPPRDTRAFVTGGGGERERERERKKTRNSADKMKLLWYRSRWNRVGDWLKKQCFRQISYWIIGLCFVRTTDSFIPPIIIDVYNGRFKRIKEPFNRADFSSLFVTRCDSKTDREMCVESVGHLSQRHIFSKKNKN